MTLPDCPRRGCDATASLKAFRADDKGCIWAFCTVCAATTLLDKDGRVLYVGPANKKAR